MASSHKNYSAPLYSAYALGQVLDAEYHRLTARFIDQALCQWDKDGEGYFDCYIRGYVARCWETLCSRN